MKRLFAFFLTCACLHGCASLQAQASLSAVAGDPPARTLTWALKVQAYQPLSWLAEPLNGDRDFRFTPRFWTGEVELGFSGRSAVQVSVGVRRYERTWTTLGITYPQYYDRERAFKITIAYRNYPKSASLGRATGPYWSPFLTYLQAKSGYQSRSIEFNGEIEITYLSTGATLGWQFCIQRHLLFDIGAGPEIAYQHTQLMHGWTPFSRPITPLEYLGAPLWRSEKYDWAGIGVTGKVMLGVGWKF